MATHPEASSSGTNAATAADIAYRPDVDGLRAIAVLAVVLFHIDARLVPGGFIGVDIFFVISGFLITSNIRNQVGQGVFTLAGFYARRIKRIVPAMATVVAATVIVGQFVMTPEHLDELARSAIASILSLANVFFTYSVDKGYFADDSATKPLLHLWSLGVEEQFYLIWPLLAVFIMSARITQRIRLTFLVVCVIAMVALSEWLTRSYPLFAYYMLPSRAFELLLGAIIAFCPRLDSPRLSQAASLIGVVLIACSLAFITEANPFPGFYAVPGTLGSAMLLYAGRRQEIWVGTVLSIAPMRWIGLISYSLYLWHWPVLAFLRYLYVPITPAVGAAAFLLMTMLSVASYLLVERPFRARRAPPGRIFVRQLLVPGGIICACCLVLVGTAGYGIYDNENYRARLTTAWRSVMPANRVKYVCQVSTITQKVLSNPNCVLNGAAGKPDVLLWGDSNAAQYVGVIGAVAKARGFAFRNVAAQGCPPVFDLPGVYERPVPRCATSNEAVRKVFGDYGTIVMGGHWSLYARSRPRFYDALRATIEEITTEGANVVLLGQIPPFGEFDRYCARKAVKLPSLKCSRLFLLPRAGNEGDIANKTLSQISHDLKNVEFLQINDIICPNDVCSPYLGSDPIYYDSAHLSVSGSWRIGEIIKDREPYSRIHWR